MKDIERRAFLNRCDNVGLPPAACALRAVVELDERLWSEKVVSRKDVAIMDELIHANEVKDIISWGSMHTRTATYACNLCTEIVKVRENDKDQSEGVLAFEIRWPMPCRAYTDVAAADLEAITSVSEDQL